MTSWTPAGDQLLAHHAALLAIPAIVPAVVVVGVVFHVARKDRREEREEREERELLKRACDTPRPPRKDDR